MKLLWIVAGVALAAGSVVHAQDSNDEEPSKSEKVVCKTKRVTGSRTKVNRTCLTKGDWDKLAQDVRDGVEMLSRDANQKESVCRRDGSQNC